MWGQCEISVGVDVLSASKKNNVYALNRFVSFIYYNSFSLEAVLQLFIRR